MEKFEVGKWYFPWIHDYEPVKVLSRTEKTILVISPVGRKWRMRIKITNNTEYVTDSSQLKSWQYAFTYHADDIAEQDWDEKLRKINL